MSAVVEQISKRTLRVEAAKALREAILTGRLPQGARLNEAHLSIQLGVSRAPIREALRELENEGLVVHTPNRGTSVVQVAVEDIAEMISVRECVEHLAVQRALQAGPLLMHSLLDALKRMREGAARGDAEAVAEAHVAFHSSIYENAHHRLLLQIWNHLKARLRLHFRMHQLALSSFQEIVAQHELLLAALESGNEESIRHELELHFRSNYGRIIESVGSLASSASRDFPPLRSNESGEHPREEEGRMYSKRRRATHES